MTNLRINFIIRNENHWSLQIFLNAVHFICSVELRRILKANAILSLKNFLSLQEAVEMFEKMVGERSDRWLLWIRQTSAA